MILPCAASAVKRSGKTHAHMLDFGILQEAFNAGCAIQPAFLVAAGLAFREKAVIDIDPDVVGAQSAYDTHDRDEILTPDAGGQTIAGAVGELDHFILRLEGLHHKHRPEDLFLNDRRID